MSDKPGSILEKFLNKSSRGQELVEFAIIFPILILFVFGVVDIGRLFHSAIVIENAAREGARYASRYQLDTGDSGEIIGVTLQEALNSGIVLDANRVFVTCPSGCASGQPIRVIVEYNFQLMMTSLIADSVIVLDRGAEMLVP